MDGRRSRGRQGRVPGCGQQGALGRRAALLLGCVAERLGDTQGALDAYRASYTANPKYEIAMGAYALLLARSGKGSDAEQFLSSKGSSDSVRLMTYQAEVKSIEGDSPGCQLLAQQALTKQPDFKDAMVVIARDLYRNHHWELAKYALVAILDGTDDGTPPRDKGNGDALLLRALIERDQGDRKSALADFDAASQKRPDLYEAYVNLGEMKLEAGNASDAQAPAREGREIRAERAHRAPRSRRLLPSARAPRRREGRVRQGAGHGLHAGGRPLRPGPAVPLLAERPGRIGSGRPAREGHHRS